MKILRDLPLSFTPSIMPKRCHVYMVLRGTLKRLAASAAVMSRGKLYLLIKDGSLKPVKIGKKTLSKETELNRFIESLNGTR